MKNSITVLSAKEVKGISGGDAVFAASAVLSIVGVYLLETYRFYARTSKQKKGA